MILLQCSFIITTDKDWLKTTAFGTRGPYFMLCVIL